MDNSSTDAKKYTITVVAKLCGLPESTLRFYETIGLIEPIERDKYTKRRVYSEDNVNLTIAIACLNATGFSIEDMRKYLENRDKGIAGAAEQIDLLHNQEKHIQDELRFMQLRLKYVKSKVEYWKAVEASDTNKIKAAGDLAYAIAKQMKLPKPISKQ